VSAATGVNVTLWPGLTGVKADAVVLQLSRKNNCSKLLQHYKNLLVFKANVHYYLI